MAVATKEQLRQRRRRRIRGKVHGTAERPRVAVYRSNLGISAQLVDHDAGRTLAAASWQMLKKFKGAKTEQPEEVAKRLAAGAKSAGVARDGLDHGGYLYRGSVKALGDAAPAGGLAGFVRPIRRP